MDLSPAAMERLEKLKEIVEAPSYTEVIKDALRLYEYFVQEDEKGSEFYIKEPDREPEKLKIFI